MANLLNVKYRNTQTMNYKFRRIDFFLFTGKAIYLDTQTISLINTCIRTIKLNLSGFIENVYRVRRLKPLKFEERIKTIFYCSLISYNYLLQQLLLINTTLCTSSYINTPLSQCSFRGQLHTKSRTRSVSLAD